MRLARKKPFFPLSSSCHTAMSPPELEGTEDVPLVGQEKTITGRSRMVFGAAMFITAMILSVTLGYVYAHKEHFPIRPGDPSHTRVSFPNQKDVQRLLELLQENLRFHLAALHGI